MILKRFFMDISNLNYFHLIYLILILLFLVGTFLLSNKKNLNKNIQHLSIWGIIFFAILISYYLWDDLKVSMSKEKFNYIIEDNNIITIEKSKDGHFYLPLTINDLQIIFLVDTGASRSLLSRKDFKLVKAGNIFLPTETILETANGIVKAKEIIFQNVKVFESDLGEISFLVATKNFKGPRISLLGLDLLNNKFKYEITNNFLKLQLIP